MTIYAGGIKFLMFTDIFVMWAVFHSSTRIIYTISSYTSSQRRHLRCISCGDDGDDGDDGGYKIL